MEQKFTPLLFLSVFKAVLTRAWISLTNSPTGFILYMLGI